VAERTHLRVPNIDRLGLGRVQPGPGLGADPVGAYGRMAEVSAGKDSMTGHWELVGIVTERPFETYPNGFPAEVLSRLEDSIGMPVLGNVVASGTEVLERFGEQAWLSGCPIVYTSADSVFQIAAHTDHTPPDMLYGWCEFLRMLMGDSVARIIARPFTGTPGAFHRIDHGRRDFPVPLPGGSVLELAFHAGVRTVGIGKVRDLFPGHPFDDVTGPGRDEKAMLALAERVREGSPGLTLANVGDLDSKYGHRNDPHGWAVAFHELDDRLRMVLELLGDDDVLIVTGDHGNDPTTPGTDHTREYVPVLACSGAGWRSGGPAQSVGERETFADVAATIAELLDLDPDTIPGTSFAPDVP